MTDPFSRAITNLMKLGFFTYVPHWLLFLAILYALLKKSKVLGESDLINATVALVASFLVIYYPVMSGIDPGPALSRFFMQMLIFFIVFVIGVAGSAIFYPDLAGLLKEKLTTRSLIGVFIVLAIIAFITSGLLDVFVKATTALAGGEDEGKKDIYTIVTGLFILVALLLIASLAAHRIRTGGGI